MSLGIVGLLAAGGWAAPASPSGADAQVSEVSSVLFDSRAPAAKRIAALDAAARDDLGLHGRPELVGSLRKLMVDRRQPADLRLAIFGRVSVLFFSVTHTITPGKADPASGHATHAAVAESFNAQVRTLLDDKDVRLQKAAFSWLAKFRDPTALDRAAEALRRQRRTPLSTAEAIGVLALVDASPFFAVIHTAYRGTREVDARVAALRVLGRYAAARKDLTSVALGRNEPMPVRRASLETLFAVDRDGFPKLVTPLLDEPSKGSEEITALILTLMRVQRAQPSYRESKLKGYDDAFDRGVRELLGRNTPLREQAHQYLLDTDPTYRPSNRPLR